MSSDTGVDCGLTLDTPCPFNKIGDRQLTDECKRHRHSKCSGFVGWYETYQCACGCHRTDNARCGRCAWCTGEHTPRRRGYELTCPHGYGCCQNCTTCAPVAAGSGVSPNPRDES